MTEFTSTGKVPGLHAGVASPGVDAQKQVPVTARPTPELPVVKTSVLQRRQDPQQEHLAVVVSPGNTGVRVNAPDVLTVARRIADSDAGDHREDTADPSISSEHDGMAIFVSASDAQEGQPPRIQRPKQQQEESPDTANAGGDNNGSLPPTDRDFSGDRDFPSPREILAQQGVPDDILGQLNPTGIASNYLNRLSSVFTIANTRYSTPEQLEELQARLRRAMITLPTYSSYCQRHFYDSTRVVEDNANIYYALMSVPNAITVEQIGLEYRSMADQDVLTNPDAIAFISDLYFRATGAIEGEEQEMLLRKKREAEQKAVRELHEALATKLANEIARVPRESGDSERHEPDIFSGARAKLKRFIGASKPGSLIFESARTELELKEAEGYSQYYTEEYRLHRKRRSEIDYTIQEEFLHIIRQEKYKRETIDQALHPKNPLTKTAQLFWDRVIRDYLDVVAGTTLETKMQLLVAAQAALDDLTAIEQVRSPGNTLESQLEETRTLLADVGEVVDITDLHPQTSDESGDRELTKTTQPESQELRNTKEFNEKIYQTAMAALTNDPEKLKYNSGWGQGKQTYHASHTFERTFPHFGVTHANGVEGIYSVHLETGGHQIFTRGNEEEKRTQAFQYSLQNSGPFLQNPNFLTINIARLAPRSTRESFRIEIHDGKLILHGWKLDKPIRVTKAGKKWILEILEQLQHSFQLNALE